MRLLAGTAAALAVKALGPENVLGIALPSPYSSKESLEDAEALARGCGCRFEVLPISDLFEGYLTSLEHLFAEFEEDVTEQNIQARIRGNLLMALSNKFGWMVLATGNKSELAVGYSTIYGDMCGGFSPIKDCLKTRVYELSTYRNTISPARSPASRSTSSCAASRAARSTSSAAWNR